MADDSSEDLPYSLADLPPGPLGDMAEFLSPSERAAIKTRRTALRGRDAPDPHTSPSTLASIAAGFLPSSGVVDALGYMPDFEGGTEASLLENWRQGNYLTAGAQALGVVPGFGGVPRIARASRGAKRLASRVPFFDRSVRLAEGEVAQADLLRRSPTVSGELARLFAHPELEGKMLEVIEDGRKLGATNWYNTEPLRQIFVKELGPDEGNKAFRKYMSYVAATSAASDVGSNARNGSYYFGLDMREGRVPAVGDAIPKPHGHWAQRNHQIFSNKVFDDQLDPLIYQKMTSFLENLTGNYAPVTVDRHALRLPAMLAKDSNFLAPKYKGMYDNATISEKPLLMEKFVKIPAAWRAPSVDEYAALEQFYKRIARKAGLAPAEAQGAAWVGGRELTGVKDNGLLSFMEHFEDRVHLTADKYRISPAEVMRRFVRGEINLSSLDGQQNAIA